MAENQGKINGLQGQKDAYQAKKEEAATAKALMESYEVENVADRPEDYSEARLAEVQTSFFDLDKEARDLGREVAKVQELKDAQDQAAADVAAAFSDKFEKAKTAYPDILDALYKAKNKYEKARLSDFMPKEDVDAFKKALDDAFDTAEKARSDLLDMKEQVQREKAVDEDMKEIKDARD